MRRMSAPTLAGKLVVAISSRALFDLTESHRVYTELGVETLSPVPDRARGRAARARARVRARRRSCCGSTVPSSRRRGDPAVAQQRRYRACACSTRSSTTGSTSRAPCSRRAEPTSRYVPAFGAHLFLSADTEDVRRALEDGYRRPRRSSRACFATRPTSCASRSTATPCCFRDEAERVFRRAGLAAFAQSETRRGGDAAVGRTVQGVPRRAAPDPGRLPRGHEPDPHGARHGAQRAGARARDPHACAPGTSASTRRCFSAASTRASSCARSAPTSSSTTRRGTSNRPRSTCRPVTCRTASPTNECSAASGVHSRCRTTPGNRCHHGRSNRHAKTTDEVP